MDSWAPTTYFPDLEEVLEDTVTFKHQWQSEFFALTLPRKAWEAMGRPGRVSFEPHPVVTNELRDAAASRLSQDAGNSNGSGA